MEAEVVEAIGYFKQFLMIITVVGIIYLLLLTFIFYWKNRVGKIRNKLYDTVKITINFKKNIF